MTGGCRILTRARIRAQYFARFRARWASEQARDRPQIELPGPFRGPTTMEFVYVVPRGELFPECYPHGLVPFSGGAGEDGFERAALETTIRERGFFVEREYAERTPSLKQVIPYTVVTRGDEVLLLRRLKKGGEARLRDKLSIGVGGHINPEDLPAGKPNARVTPDGTVVRDPVAAGSAREIEEEIDLDGEHTIHAVGILNDDSNPVGAVHVGWVQVLKLASGGDARIREQEVLEGSFVPREELVSLLESGANLETWSALLVSKLDEILPASQETSAGAPVS